MAQKQLDYLYYNNTDHSERSTISALFGNLSLKFTGDFSLDTTSSNKRSGIRDLTEHTIMWNSKYGSHVAAVVGNSNLTYLAHKIANAVPAEEREDDRAINVRKRWNYFDVDWTSYSYDNANQDLAIIVAGDRDFLELDYDSGIYDFFDNNQGWKYCLAATVNRNPGSDEGYDQIGQCNAFHGELYFNTYGGIDGYCEDNKDGAQCSIDGCGD